MNDLLLLTAICFGLLFIVCFLYHKDFINDKTYILLGFIICLGFIIVGVFYLDLLNF